jgi:hypothetical protein
MRGRDLDVAVVPTPVRLLVLDADVREMHLAIEVRQVMFAGPLPDLFRRSIGVAVVVLAVPIALVQPLLVLTLELVVEDDPLDAGAALQEGFCLAFVGPVDLDVVLQFPLGSDAGVEGLLVLSVPGPLCLATLL